LAEADIVGFPLESEGAAHDVEQDPEFRIGEVRQELIEQHIRYGGVLRIIESGKSFEWLARAITFGHKKPPGRVNATGGA